VIVPPQTVSAIRAASWGFGKAFQRAFDQHKIGVEAGFQPAALSSISLAAI
jgi:hypothetical protein